MVRRSGVASLAVGLTTVIKVGRSPGVGVMTDRALPAVMVRWSIIAVASLAVSLTAVIKAGRSPGVGIMAA